MTEALATANNDNALAFLTGDAIGKGSYEPCPNFFTYAWKKTESDDLLLAAELAGVKLEGDSVHFALNRAGQYNFYTPFRFFLIHSTPACIRMSKKGELLKVSSQKFDDCQEAFVALFAVLAGSTVIPAVATIGRIKGGLCKGIQQARIAQQQYAVPDLAARGQQFASAANLPLPWRCVFTLSGRAAETKDGENEYIKTSCSGRPVTADDVAALDLADVKTPTSNFGLDFAKCLSVYQSDTHKIAEGWEKS